MKKRDQNSAQPNNTSRTEAARPKEGLLIAGPIKKCPSCGEDLPEKIAFCLYCMKNLREDAEQSRQNGENRSKWKPKKILVWVAAVVAALVVVVGVTSTVTASILLRHWLPNHHRSRPAITAPANQNELNRPSAQSPTPEAIPAPEQIPENVPNPVPEYVQTSEQVPASESDTTPEAIPEPALQETPAQNLLPGNNRSVRPLNPTISLERAIEIGYEELARRGYTGTFRERSGLDWEYGQWVWEIEFRVVGGRRPFVEMYINVDTGSVVKFEWDD
jgi:uncharacterized membrane protein YkoI